MLTKTLTIGDLRDITGGLVDSRTPMACFYDTTKHLKKKGLEKYPKDEAVIKGIRNDDDLQNLFKPRIPGDLTIRRCRMIDYWKVLTNTEKATITRLKHLDYILVCNLIIYAVCHGFDKLELLIRSGILEDRQVFLDTASKLSSAVKKLMLWSEDKQLFAELGVLSGYQQEPVDGFDKVEKTKELAEGGNDHGLPGDKWKDTFNTYLAKLSFNDAKHTRWFKTLKEYIYSEEWCTAGSSSIGKVEYTKDGKTYHFKARKNMLPMIMTLDEIYDLAANWDGRLHSKAITKNELGKIRIAVASDVAAYLNESFIFQVVGHPYKNWPGVTLDESPTTQANREAEIRRNFTAGNWSLPFDYAMFDHQVSTWEVQQIVGAFGADALLRNPTVETGNIIRKVISSYANSVLTVDTNNGTESFTVTGGIPSGVRSTSIVGNTWNKVMTSIAIDYAKTVRPTTWITSMSIRGDDSLLLSEDPMDLFTVRLCYAAENAIGHNAKFGLLYKHGEFLRNVITSDIVNGWTNRAIPALSQRKPWNSEAWTPLTWVRTLYKACDTISRRQRYCVDRVYEIVRRKWSHATKQSNRWLDLPTRLGGLGLGTWTGWVTDRRLPTPQKPGLDFSTIQPSDELSWIYLDEAERITVNKMKLEDAVAADDVPGTQTRVFRTFKTAIAKIQPAWYRIPIQQPNLTVYLPEVDSGNYHFPRNRIKTPTFTSINTNFPKVDKFIDEYKTVSRIKKVPSLATYLQANYPDFYETTRCYERAGWHRSDAITLSLGSIPSEPTKRIHPVLTPFVTDALVRKGLLYQRGRLNIAKILSTWTTSACESMMRQAYCANLYAY